MSQDFWFLLLPGFSVMGFVSAVEPLRVANRFHADLYRWHVLSADGGPVLASNGMSVNSDGALEPLKKGDLLFVVAGFEPLRAVTPALVQWLRKLDRNGVTLGGIDTGSVVLAEAGLLDGRRATLHWEAIDAFQESYPQLSVTQELFEIDGPRITSAGGTASIDLMLDLIAQAHGPQLAVQVSEQFVLGRIRPRQDHQRLQVATRYGVSNRKLVQVIGEMERHTEPPLTTLELAERIQVTRRQLERLFRVPYGRHALELLPRPAPGQGPPVAAPDRPQRATGEPGLRLRVAVVLLPQLPRALRRQSQPGSRGAAAQGSRSHAARRASRASHASS